jgi:hypothetical protein
VKNIRAAMLAKKLGMPRRTMAWICKNDPELAYKKGRIYYIRVSVLATKPGFDIISALLSPHCKWIKARELARISGIPVRTMGAWCKTRPNFARRISNVWYVDLEQLGATPAQIKLLSKPGRST